MVRLAMGVPTRDSGTSRVLTESQTTGNWMGSSWSIQYSFALITLPVKKHISLLLNTESKPFSVPDRPPYTTKERELRQMRRVRADGRIAELSVV